MSVVDGVRNYVCKRTAEAERYKSGKRGGERNRKKKGAGE